MKHENVEFPEAVEMLAGKAGIVLPRASGRKDENSLTSQLYKINELAAEFFQEGLAHSGAAREYLASRGIGEATIAKFKIGYAPDSWEALINFLRLKA